MSPHLPRQRPLSVGPIRAFEAVARLSSFRAAGEELHLTQSAISRQISALEEEIGAPLFSRGTRHVGLTPDGQTLLRAVLPTLGRLDTTVQQIRQSRGRQVVNLNTFASLASLWLLPQLEAFQRAQPDIDIRISTSDKLVDIDSGEVDLVVRNCRARNAPAGAQRLFGEVVTPVISRWLAARIQAGEAPPLAQPSDLSGHTLVEEEGDQRGTPTPGWRPWLEQQGLARLQPRRWTYVNYSYQQVQAALSGHAVALVRMALVADALERGDLLEPFGPEGRLQSEHAYWLLLAPASRERQEVGELQRWILQRSALTRAAMGEPEDLAPA